MKRKTLFIGMGILLFFLIVGSLLFIVYNQITKLADYVNDLPQGEDAVNVMNEVEKDFLNDKLLKIEKGMTEDNLVAILGQPYKSVGTQNTNIAYWSCPQTEECRLRIKIQDGNVHAIEWFKMNAFFWKKEFGD